MGQIHIHSHVHNIFIVTFMYYLFLFCSFIYVIVSTDGLVRPDKSTENLAYLDATHSGLVYYVAAALSYKEYSDSNTFTLGNNKITTGLNGQIFNNVKLNTDTTYYYFIRAYSLHYNEQVQLLMLAFNIVIIMLFPYL